MADKMKRDAGFDALIAVVTKSFTRWDIPPCSPLKVYRCF
jgi:hypothetical protein